MSGLRISKEGRHWVVRQRCLALHSGRVVDVWKPVMWAASEEQAREYIKRQQREVSNAR